MQASYLPFARSEGNSVHTDVSDEPVEQQAVINCI